MTGEELEPKRDLPERTFRFATRVVKLCRGLEKTSGSDRVLAHQLLRAACSIGANVEEGQASQSRADFTAKYYIACKEARETHYWLRLVAAAGIVPEKRIADLLDEASQIVAILTTIVKKTRARAKVQVNREQ